MEPRRVFILYRSPLFARGLSSLLSKESSLQVVGMGQEQEKAWKDIQSLAPHVIILEEGDATPLARVLDAAPGAQLVALSLSHNRIRIYGHRDVQGQGLEGVIEALAQVSREALGDLGGNVGEKERRRG